MALACRWIWTCASRGPPPAPGSLRDRPSCPSTGSRLSGGSGKYVCRYTRILFYISEEIHVTSKGKAATTAAEPRVVIAFECKKCGHKYVDLSSCRKHKSWSLRIRYYTLRLAKSDVFTPKLWEAKWFVDQVNPSILHDSCCLCSFSTWSSFGSRTRFGACRPAGTAWVGLGTSYRGLPRGKTGTRGTVTDSRFLLPLLFFFLFLLLLLLLLHQREGLGLGLSQPGYTVIVLWTYCEQTDPWHIWG